jgi:hypothetical protein
MSEMLNPYYLREAKKSLYREMLSQFVDAAAYSIQAICIDECDPVLAATLAMLALESHVHLSH